MSAPITVTRLNRFAFTLRTDRGQSASWSLEIPRYRGNTGCSCRGKLRKTKPWGPKLDDSRLRALNFQRGRLRVQCKDINATQYLRLTRGCSGRALLCRCRPAVARWRQARAAGPQAVRQAFGSRLAGGLMSISVAAGLFLAVLIGIAWLQFRLLAYLRKSSIRYRWFELFSCLFLIAIGLVLLTAPRGSSIDFLWLLGGGCILSGAISLEPVLRTRFV